MGRPRLGFQTRIEASVLERLFSTKGVIQSGFKCRLKRGTLPLDVSDHFQH